MAGRSVRHFNVSLILWAKSRCSVHKPHILKRKESRCGSNGDPSAHQPCALPLGHTGSQAPRLKRHLSQSAEGTLISTPTWYPTAGLEVQRVWPGVTCGREVFIHTWKQRLHHESNSVQVRSRSSCQGAGFMKTALNV